MALTGLLVISSFSSACRFPVGSAERSAKPVIRMYPVVKPLLKGLDSDPALRMDITVPADMKASGIRRFHCTLDQAGYAAVKRVDIYRTEGEAFSEKELVASKVPGTAAFDIPAELELKPGVNRLWFSLVLNDRAGPHDRVRFSCDRLTGRNGEKLVPEQAAGISTWPVGIALRKKWDDSVHTYRIPGIVQTDKGTLLAVYDIRYTTSRDLPGNIDVGLSRSTDGGKTWSPMRVIMDMGAPHANNGIGDPAILFDPVTGRVWVAALWSKGNRSIAGSLPGLSPDTTGQLVLVSSEDDGITWTAPESITPQVKDPAWHIFFNGPGNGIAMSDGRIVFAAQYWDEVKMPYSTIIYSDDHGKSWKGGIRGPRSNTTESQVVEMMPGKLMLNMRDNRGGARSVATTTDMGHSWQPHPTSFSALPDPVCMASLIKAKVRVKGVLREVLFFSNPNTSKGRHHMTIKASLDSGSTWLPANSLLVDERECYGYSSLVGIDEDHVGILYEGERELYFVIYSVNEIIRD